MSSEEARSAAEVELLRRHGAKTLHALREVQRLSALGQRLAARGHEWFVSDPDNVPGLAAESLIVKIGENVGRISDELKRAHPEIPWRDIKQMRNRLTHYYEATDYELVWNTLRSDLPAIGGWVTGILAEDA